MGSRSGSDVNRREFLGAAATAGLALSGSAESHADAAPLGLAGRASAGLPNTAPSLEDNVYTRLLGVRPHLGAHEHISRLGGGRMSRMVLDAAACLTGTDEAKVQALPHPTWERRECLIQTAQRFDYDRAFRCAGATVVYADTRAELAARLGPTTAF